MRTLFLANEDFRSRDSGSRTRDWYMAEALAHLGEVVVLCFSPEVASGAVRNLPGVEFLVDAPVGERRATVRALVNNSMYHSQRYAFSSHREADFVRGQSFDLVYVSMMYGFDHLEDLVDSYGPSPKVLWDTHVFDPDVWRMRSSAGRASDRIFARWLLPRSTSLAEQSVDRSNLILACTDRDAEDWRLLAGSTPVEVIPNATDVAGWSDVFQRPGDGDTFVLFGSLNQNSTVSGALWFLDDVWPVHVIEQPDALLILAGRNPGPTLQRAVSRSPRTELVADPSDIRDSVGRAASVVAPQTWGSGSKLKMYDAIGSGRRVIASPQAVTGLPTELAGLVDVVESIQDWLDAMADPIGEPDRIAHRGQVERVFGVMGSWPTSQRRLQAIVKDLVG